MAHLRRGRVRAGVKVGVKVGVTVRVRVWGEWWGECWVEGWVVVEQACRHEGVMAHLPHPCPEVGQDDLVERALHLAALVLCAGVLVRMGAICVYVFFGRCKSHLPHPHPDVGQDDFVELALHHAALAP